MEHQGRRALLRQTLRSGLSFVLPAALILSQFAWRSAADSPAYAAGQARQVPFTPHVTPLQITVTPEATVLGTVGAQSTPSPYPPSEVPLQQSLEPPDRSTGGDDTIGYELIEGSQPPLWRIWYEGEELIIRGDDPSATSLLSAFMIEADNRAESVRALDQANHTLTMAGAGGFFGLVSLAGGLIAAGAACSATPLTLGTTFPICVGGVISAVGGIGALGVSGGIMYFAARDRNTALKSLRDSTADAEECFRALQELSSQ